MTDAPLRANPEDRPLPPTGGSLPASPTGGSLPASPTGGNPAASPTVGTSPVTPSSSGEPDAKAPGAARSAAAPKKATANYLRPIGSRAQPKRDWRAAWAGFLIGVVALAAAVGLTMVLWDMAGATRTARAPVEPLPPIDLAELEALLDNLGFPPGEVDGMIDADTSAAIRDFQATAGLTVDGTPSAELLEELRAAHLELTGGQ